MNQNTEEEAIKRICGELKEIEFRGLCDRGWVYGFIVIDDDGESNIVNNYEQSYSWVKVIPKTIGQYIGFKDKNDIKIFEGDKFIIKSKIMYVKYNNDNARYVLTTGLGYDSKNCVNLDCDIIFNKEIIGNIHQNHELL